MELHHADIFDLENQDDPDPSRKVDILCVYVCVHTVPHCACKQDNTALSIVVYPP